MKMRFLLLGIYFAIFGCVTATRPRSVNVILQTAVEFHKDSDLDLIKTAQKYLTKVRNILEKNKGQHANFRQGNNPVRINGMIKEALKILSSFSEKNLLNILKIFSSALFKLKSEDNILDQENYIWLRQHLLDKINGVENIPVENIRIYLNKIRQFIDQEKHVTKYLFDVFDVTILEDEIEELLQSLKFYQKHRLISRASFESTIKNILYSIMKKYDKLGYSQRNKLKELFGNEYYDYKSIGNSKLHFVNNFNAAMLQYQKMDENVKNLTNFLNRIHKKANPTKKSYIWPTLGKKNQRITFRTTNSEILTSSNTNFVENKDSMDNQDVLWGITKDMLRNRDSIRLKKSSNTYKSDLEPKRSYLSSKTNMVSTLTKDENKLEFKTQTSNEENDTSLDSSRITETDYVEELAKKLFRSALKSPKTILSYKKPYKTFRFKENINTKPKTFETSSKEVKLSQEAYEKSFKKFKLKESDAETDPNNSLQKAKHFKRNTNLNFKLKNNLILPKTTNTISKYSSKYNIYEKDIKELNVSQRPRKTKSIIINKHRLAKVSSQELYTQKRKLKMYYKDTGSSNLTKKVLSGKTKVTKKFHNKLKQIQQLYTNVSDTELSKGSNPHLSKRNSFKLHDNQMFEKSLERNIVENPLTQTMNTGKDKNIDSGIYKQADKPVNLNHRFIVSKNIKRNFDRIFLTKSHIHKNRIKFQEHKKLKNAANLEGNFLSNEIEEKTNIHDNNMKETEKYNLVESITDLSKESNPQSFQGNSQLLNLSENRHYKRNEKKFKSKKDLFSFKTKNTNKLPSISANKSYFQENQSQKLKDLVDKFKGITSKEAMEKHKIFNTSLKQLKELVSKTADFNLSNETYSNLPKDEYPLFMENNDLGKSAEKMKFKNDIAISDIDDNDNDDNKSDGMPILNDLSTELKRHEQAVLNEDTAKKLSGVTKNKKLTYITLYPQGLEQVSTDNDKMTLIDSRRNYDNKIEIMNKTTQSTRNFEVTSEHNKNHENTNQSKLFQDKPNRYIEFKTSATKNETHMNSRRKNTIENERKKGNYVYKTNEISIKKSNVSDFLITTLATSAKVDKIPKVNEKVPNYGKSEINSFKSNVTNNVYLINDRNETIEKFQRNNIFVANVSKTTENSKSTAKYVTVNDAQTKTNLSRTWLSEEMLKNAVNTFNISTFRPKVNFTRPKKEFIDVNRLIKIGGIEDKKEMNNKEKEVNEKMKQDLLFLFGPTKPTTKNNTLDFTDTFQELEEAFNLS